MKKYVATRKDICAGRLIKIGKISFGVLDENNNEISKEKVAEQGIIGINASFQTFYRGMLFNINENGLANDLIYTTPTNYQIEGIEPKIEVKSDFVISQYVELEELLKYLNYDEDLTQKDLDQIFRKLILSEWWLRHHPELFGWIKLKGIGYFYGADSVETIPKRIYDTLTSFYNAKPSKDEPDYGLIKRRK